MTPPNPYLEDQPKPVEMLMEITALRADLRRKEVRLDQFECAIVEFVSRRHRSNTSGNKKTAPESPEAA